MNKDIRASLFHDDAERTLHGEKCDGSFLSGESPEPFELWDLVGENHGKSHANRTFINITKLRKVLALCSKVYMSFYFLL